MARRSRRVPECGDVVWLNSHPQTGHEQDGRRPALVLSPKAYNRKVGLAIVCPITNRSKGYPFEVEVKGSTRTPRTTGVVLADQVKSMDWRARNAEVKDRVSDEVVEEVRAKLMAIIDSDA